MATKKDRDKKAARRVSAQDWAKKQSGDREATCVKLPDGCEFYKLTPGIHKLDFLPYRVGKGNPRADEGEEHFERTYDIHWVPTPTGNRPYACRKACFGKRCAVCDWLTKSAGHADQEMVKDLRAKTRHLWIVNDRLGSKSPQIKILETGHANRGVGFAELMADAINTLDDETNPFVLEGGYTAVLKAMEQPWGTKGKKYTAVTRIDLRPHVSYDYPPSLIDELPCLDDMIVDPGYDEVKALLDPDSVSDSDDDDADDDPKPVSRTRPKPSKPEPEDDDDSDDDDAPAKPRGKGKTAMDLKLKVGQIVEHEDLGECEIVRISGDGTSLKIKDEDGEIHSAISPEDVTKVEVADDDADADGGDDSDDDVPAKPAPRGKPKPSKPEADDDDEDDDAEEEDDDSDSDDDGEDADDDDVDDDDPPPARGRGRGK